MKNSPQKKEEHVAKRLFLGIENTSRRSKIAIFDQFF
jgi:hypothetical protein